MKVMLGMVVALGLLAGCGGDDSTTATTTTKAPVVEQNLIVRVTAQIVGLGCTGISPVGNGDQLVVLDPGGTKIGVGTFALSPGADSCDWTASAKVPSGEDLYTLQANGEELATVDAEQDGWIVRLAASIGGNIEVVTG